VSVDPATLKPGDRIRSGYGCGGEGTVLAVDGGDIFARGSSGYAFITDGQYWELVPPPPPIDPEQVWCISSEGSVYRDFPTAPATWQRFRITQIEMVE
jgi:hypothetical protein